VHAIGDEAFALQKIERFFRPVDAIAEPVGNIDGAIPIEANHTRAREVEIRVVVGDNGIVKDGVLQFLPVLNPAGDHRIGIHRTSGRQQTRLGRIGIRQSRLAVG
jgi:hypothetical protein